MQKDRRTSEAASPSRQLAGFMAHYSVDVRSKARTALAKIRAMLHGWFELVYDNYNALAIDFGPTDRPSEAVFSLALYPRWVTLFFLNGAGLPDPDGLLKGSGRKVRRVVLKNAKDLDSKGIRELMLEALKSACAAPALSSRRRTLIKSVSVRQRPRLPAPANTAGVKGARRHGRAPGPESQPLDPEENRPSSASPRRPST